MTDGQYQCADWPVPVQPVWKRWASHMALRGIRAWEAERLSESAVELRYRRL